MVKKPKTTKLNEGYSKLGRSLRREYTIEDDGTAMVYTARVYGVARNKPVDVAVSYRFLVANAKEGYDPFTRELQAYALKNSDRDLANLLELQLSGDRNELSGSYDAGDSSPLYGEDRPRSDHSEG